jgi:hypothetical protein
MIGGIPPRTENTRWLTRMRAAWDYLQSETARRVCLVHYPTPAIHPAPGEHLMGEGSTRERLPFRPNRFSVYNKINPTRTRV